MSRKLVLCLILIFIAGFAFGQTSALRDYVGMISQNFHPDIISLLQKFKNVYEERNLTARVRNLENFMRGDSGTGFVYVDSDGKNYILTNYHVISQAYTLTITFETVDGEKTKFSDLQIIAADEDMDIALLAFAGGQNPFRQGLSLINRPINEGEDVYSAGFPGTGNTMIWQLGRGIISNASVRLPPEDENDKAIGPYIQHTAQIDGGNSGGPLLIQTQGVPTGYAVAGINTLSIRSRQAANYSIPVTRIRSFLDESMKPPAADQRPILEERVNAFVKGLSANRAVYPHIAQFLSNTCVGENVEYAFIEGYLNAPESVLIDLFDREIISAFTHFVAWTIEDSLRSRSGNISATVDSINPGENGSYNVSFKVNNNIVNSVWVNEYGFWRIRSFGTVASGDKTLLQKRARARTEAASLRDEPFLMISAGLAMPFDLDGVAFGVNLTAKIGKYVGIGPRAYFGGEKYTQIEIGAGAYVPIKIGPVALTPFANVAVGLMFYPKDTTKSVYETTLFDGTAFGVSARGGLIFTTSWVPGLFLEAAYQYNLYQKEVGSGIWLYPGMIYIGVGYAF
jgi:serine protease Do